MFNRIAKLTVLAGLLTVALLACSDMSGVGDPSEPRLGHTRSALMTQADCPPGSHVIVGTDGADNIVGTNGDDCILGLGGDDIIVGGDGNDTIFGGPGNDTISGGNGQDVIYGEDGDDVIMGDNGDDVIAGGAGHDVISGGNGNDAIQGDDGNDVIDGNNGDNTLSGGPGNDLVIAGKGNDVVDGGAGIDVCSKAGPGCEQVTSPSSCAADADCSAGQRCLTAVGVCVSCLADTECDDQNVSTFEQCVPTTGCSYSSCNTDYADCNDSASDSCETDLTTTANCGGCGVTCNGAVGPRATNVCTNGTCEVSFGFFAVSDVHVADPPTNIVTTAVAQMGLIDSGAIAAFSAGDHTDRDTLAQWNSFIGFINAPNSMFDATATDFQDFQGKARFLAAMGNHDLDDRTNWYTRWNTYLTGQAGLGHNGTDGIYYSVTYENALFVMLDGQHVSAPQTQLLASTLQGSSARFKFVFFHQPVYSCLPDLGHAAFAAALPWVDLSEKNNVDVIFSGHTHVYTRTCRRTHAGCMTDGTGIVQLETGTLGSSQPRPPTTATSTFTVSGTDFAGNARIDSYNCNLIVSDGDGNNLKFKQTTAINDFCHVQIVGCKATIQCYTVGAGNTTPFDTWEINHCQ